MWEFHIMFVQWHRPLLDNDSDIKRKKIPLTLNYWRLWKRLITECCQSQWVNVLNTFSRFLLPQSQWALTAGRQSWTAFVREFTKCLATFLISATWTLIVVIVIKNKEKKRWSRTKYRKRDEARDEERTRTIIKWRKIILDSSAEVSRKKTLTILIHEYFTSGWWSYHKKKLQFDSKWKLPLICRFYRNFVSSTSREIRRFENFF